MTIMLISILTFLNCTKTEEVIVKEYVDFPVEVQVEKIYKYSTETVNVLYQKITVLLEKVNQLYFILDRLQD